jgi:hypothetical protein
MRFTLRFLADRSAARGRAQSHESLPEQENGQIVELISYHDKDYAMVRNQSGSVSYVTLDDLEEYQVGKGRTGVKLEAPRAKDELDKDEIPVQTIPPDTRLNLNLATAEMIAQRIKGVGYSTAKKNCRDAHEPPRRTLPDPGASAQRWSRRLGPGHQGRPDLCGLIGSVPLSPLRLPLDCERPGRARCNFLITTSPVAVSTWDSTTAP